MTKPIDRGQALARTLGSLLLAAALLFALPTVTATAAEEEEVRVVYHADFADPRRFSAMLTSIHNMVNYYDNNFIDHDVSIVFVAHGIRFVTDNKLAGTPFEEDAALAERRDNLRGRLLSLQSLHNVRLELCDITRSGIGLTEDALYEGVELVPSGVVRLAELQRQGVSYLKIE